MKKMFYIFYAGLVCCGAATAITSCSDDTYGPDPEKNWSGTTETFIPTDEKGFRTYYNPAIGRCGDPMPFYDQKAQEFKVLYLQEYDNNGACYHPYWGVSTTDGANYVPMGEVLPTGTSNKQQDAVLGTGCAVYNENDGLYYIYYTGYNILLSNREVVMRATSPDFKNWTRDYSWSLRGADYEYSKMDFRDPQIFKIDDGTYRMVISTSPAAGGDPVFAEFKSTDMKNWENVGPFKMLWNRMCECPDIFKMGDWWYLIYSDASHEGNARTVKYVKADSYENLKKCFNDPDHNFPDDKQGQLDSRGFYAGKTAFNGTDRYIWGWCPYRKGADIFEKNVNVGAEEPEWSGALVCHKIVQHADGTISFGSVQGIDAKYDKTQEVNVMASNGYSNGTLAGEGAYVLYTRLGVCNHISFTVTTANQGDKFGISLVRGTDSEKYYTMVVNPEDGNAKRKINFEEEGKEGKGFIGNIDGYMFPTPSDNTYKVDIYTDNSVMVMYINDNVCYTNRIYGIQKNCWSINGYGGTITISDVRVSQQ